MAGPGELVSISSTAHGWRTSASRIEVARCRIVAPGGALLWTVRLVVGTAMGASLVLGFSAIRRRDITAHRAWMIRAYALGLGAGTQVFTESIGAAALGTGDGGKAVSLSAGWIINAVVAEWLIRRPARPRRRTASTALAPRAVSASQRGRSQLSRR